MLDKIVKAIEMQYLLNRIVQSSRDCYNFVVEEGAKREGIELDHQLEGEAWRKLCLSQFQVHEMNKDF